MKKFIALFSSILLSFISFAQPTISPAPPQSQAIALIHATIHIGNGEVIQDGMIVFDKGKIIDVRATMPIADVKIIDCSGKQIYPGLIASATDLGLNEISAVKSTLDEYELGELNPNVRALVAYNTDSKIIPTVRSNGILLANIIPGGGILSGASSVMQLDGWNWEDAVYKADQGIHFNMPSLARYSFRGMSNNNDVFAHAMKTIDGVRTFFREAKAYLNEAQHAQTNIKFESVKGLFDQSKTFYIHCDMVKEMMIASAFAQEFGFKTVIVGGAESWKIADYLHKNNIAVILDAMHNLPLAQDDDVDQPYKTPYILQQAGVLYAIADNDGNSRYRNLPFNAGTAAAYGLTKEEALQAITLNAAKILGIDDKTGTLQKGKDANIVVSEGDILDMKTSIVTLAFIQGRQINLDNKQKELYEKYEKKYGLQ